MDAYAAALKVPNILRNLLGEGTLSASFVPVYSDALGRGDDAGARRVARGILGIVLLASGLLVAIGIAVAPWLAAVLVPGFDAELTALTASLIRILFPMSGLMIAGAWCLGVLTSHRRFFLPFAAPGLWNLAQIVGLLVGARLGWEPLIFVLAWSTLVGGALQVAVQLPSARRLAGTLRPGGRWRDPSVRTVTRNAGPVAAGQGVFQVSSLVDVMLASTLAAAGWGGAISALYFAQRIVQLPMALFGVSVAVAALPEMSRESVVEALEPHIRTGVRRILYFILPAAVILAMYGDLVVGVVYQRAAFGAEDARLVSWILAAYAVGLIATSLVKLFASGFHSLQDTRTPMRYAIVSVFVGIATGAALMFWFVALGLEARSATGLALGGAAGAWLNLVLLARGLSARGVSGVWSARRLGRIALGAVAAAGISWPVASWASSWAIGTGLLARSAELAVVLCAGGVPYLLIAGAPGPLRRKARA